MGIHDGHRERKKAQFLNSGGDAFEDHELLELLLFYAIPRRDVNPIAHALLERFGTLDGVLSAPAEELERVDGMGWSAAVLLKLVPQAERRARLSAAANERVLDTSERIGDFCLQQLAGQRQETVCQLCLDAKGRLLACRKLCEGDAGSVSLNLRKVVENAILTNAVMVALAHNHPSGIALPSREDRVVTEEARAALETIHVRLVDHIIVADDDYISLRQAGLL